MAGAGLILGNHAVGQVGGEGREGAAGGGDGFGLGGAGLVGVDQMVAQGAVQHAGAGQCGVGRGAVRAAGFGALRDGDQQRGLSRGQAAGFLAEIGEGGGADAFDIAAIGGEVEVQRQDLLFGQVAFEGEGDADLAQFARLVSRCRIPPTDGRPAWSGSIRRR